MTKQEFMESYVLLRASIVKDYLSGLSSAQEAQRIWDFIKFSVENEIEEEKGE